MTDLVPAGQAVRYLAVGALSVGVDVGGLVLLREVVGLPLWLATSIAFGASLVLNFLLNRSTFGGGGAAKRQAARYGALVAANYLLTVTAVSAAGGAGVPYLVIKLVVLMASTVWNFLLDQRWVFADPPDAVTASADSACPQ